MVAAAALTLCAPAVAAAEAENVAPTIAIVVQDQTALRAAPRDSGQLQATLWPGDTLEIRGERLDHLQVYDYRRERGGFVRASALRRVSLQAGQAPELLAVVRFLRDTPGSEALGMAYAAAYLKAAPADAITAEPLDALGTMAERLARRASSRQAKANDPVLAAHLEAAAGLGVVMTSFERDGRMQLCYDGDAFRRVLAMQATPEQRARAALGLTRDDCIAPTLPPLQRQQLLEDQAQLLERIDIAPLPELLKNRIRMRRAAVWAGVAFTRSRQGTNANTAEAGEHALQSLAEVVKAQLTDDDQWAYNDAAVRVGASRWAGAAAATSKGRLAIATSAGQQPGETCVALTDAQHDAAHPLLRRCTYGTVWTASASVSADGSALAVAVQPLATWRELWVFHRNREGWTVDTLPPATGDTQLGVVEFAGWVPGGGRLLAAREAKVDGRFKRSFEVIRLDTLVAEKQADKPDSLSTFYRWQDAGWKRQTVMLR
ncbi:hypothetical protein [Ideonella sp. BN130291]|uniref:hypothetical protein n=1 Tax=Ideonella sp. BN130291 TaxID=3112940 RepID=UPI003FA52C9D